MTLLLALERSVPGATAHLEGVAPLPIEEFAWKDQGADFICAYGLSGALYRTLRGWLDRAKGKRHLVFIEERPEALARLMLEPEASLLLNDPRVKILFLTTPLQVEWAAKKTAWRGVFLKMELLDVAKSPHFAHFAAVAQETHRAAGLLLSDAVDWGCSLLKNAKANLSRPWRSAFDVNQGAFAGVPALIVGAGPSLERDRDFVKLNREKALIFAGGNALERLGCAPHFATAIDKSEPPKNPFPEVPIVFQARVHPGSFASSKGERLLLPEGHFPFLNWLSGEEALFDGGWTVGNAQTALALHWGCDPIVFVGMDYCYRQGKKYAFGKKSDLSRCVPALDAAGKEVLTQSDWLMAVHWTEALAKQHPDRQFLNLSQGLAMGRPVDRAAIAWPDQPDLSRRVQEAIQPLQVRSQTRFTEWKESLIRAQALCTKGLCPDGEVDWGNEIVHSQLLLPLWHIWRPVFEREIDFERDPEKLRLNELLFYQGVIKRMLRDFR